MRREFRNFITPGILIGAIVVAFVLLAISLVVLMMTRHSPSAQIPATAVVTVIPAPTTVPPTFTLEARPTPTPTSASALPPSPPPGEITTGAYVQITGTGGDGLRLRTEPGLNADVRILGAEAEVFLVKDGPRQVDGYTWWYLVGPYDSSRRGWAVSNYLAVVQNP
jgi:hypothetical protein